MFSAFCRTRMSLASAGVTVKLSGVTNVGIEFVSPRYVVVVDATLLQPAPITAATARIAITVEIRSVLILFMQFESGSSSVITVVITQHEKQAFYKLATCRVFGFITLLCRDCLPL